MTFEAEFILNELPVGETIKDDFNFIENNPLSYDLFIDYHFLRQQLENFKINEKLSEKMQNKMINEFLNDFIPKINKIKEKAETLNSVINLTITDPDVAFFSVMAKISTIQYLDKQNQNISTAFLKSIQEDIQKTLFLGLDADKKEILSEGLKSIDEFLYVENFNEAQSKNTNLMDNIQEIFAVLKQNINQDYPYEKIEKYDEHCIILDKSMDKKLALQFKKELESLGFKTEFLIDDTSSTIDDKRYILIFGDSEDSILNAKGSLLDSESCSIVEDESLIDEKNAKRTNRL